MSNLSIDSDLDSFLNRLILKLPTKRAYEYSIGDNRTL
jgi:hypothetical protein